MVSDWILDENFRALVNVLGWQLGYRLTDEAWEHIEKGLDGTDADHGRWASYHLHGTDGASAILRYGWTDPVAGVPYIDVEIVARAPVEKAAEIAVRLMQNYRLILDQELDNQEGADRHDL